MRGVRQWTVKSRNDLVVTGQYSGSIAALPIPMYFASLTLFDRYAIYFDLNEVW